MDWRAPQSKKEVERFLGLMNYIRNFLPRIAEFASVLTPLTKKDALFAWLPRHQLAFDRIKALANSVPFLKPLDYSPDAPPIWVITDASKIGTGAVLAQGTNWKTAHPAAFESSTYIPAERNYPTHEQELLAIKKALEKWRYMLIGIHFRCLTDHKSIKGLFTQRDLSPRQARWVARFADFDMDIDHIPGSTNVVADYLSRYPVFAMARAATRTQTVEAVIATITGTHRRSARLAQAAHAPPAPTVSNEERATAAEEEVTASDIEENVTRDHVEEGTDDEEYSVQPPEPVLEAVVTGETLADIQLHGATDPFYQKVLKNLPSLPFFSLDHQGLLRFNNRLVIPKHPPTRTALLHEAHDVLLHPGYNKTLHNLRAAVYWPSQAGDTEEYCRTCDTCQRSKQSTSPQEPPIVMLPIPDEKAAHVTVDWIGPLTMDGEHDQLMTVTERPGGAVRLIPTNTRDPIATTAFHFFAGWCKDFGFPKSIVSDRDKAWRSHFWQALLKLTGTRMDLSTADHPESDGRSEITNKMVGNALRCGLLDSPSGWVRKLPTIEFAINTTINKSTRMTPAQYMYGFTPQLSLRLLSTTNPAAEEFASDILNTMQTARDSMAAAKAAQAHHSNKGRKNLHTYAVNDLVWLNAKNIPLRSDHPKFASRRAGPFAVVAAFPATHTYKLHLPFDWKQHPVFNSRLLSPYYPSDELRFPGRRTARPTALDVDAHGEIFEVDGILKHRWHRRRWEYFVSWAGYGAEERSWLPGVDIDKEALDDYWQTQPADLRVIR
jgi:hypothetical protein